MTVQPDGSDDEGQERGNIREWRGKKSMTCLQFGNFALSTKNRDFQCISGT